MMIGEMVGGEKILLRGIAVIIQQRERTPVVEHALSQEHVDMQRAVAVTLERIQESCCAFRPEPQAVRSLGQEEGDWE